MIGFIRGARSIGYGKRVVKPLDKKLREAKSQPWTPKSIPYRPIFAKPRKDGRNDFFRACWWRDFRPRWIAQKVRDDRTWLKHYGLRQKLSNAATSTRIRREVAQKTAIKKALKK